MLREKPKQSHCKGENTDTWHGGGLTGSSDEPAVMVGERSGQLIQRFGLIN
jgi:hypothetical protein